MTKFVHSARDMVIFNLGEIFVSCVILVCDSFCRKLANLSCSFPSCSAGDRSSVYRRKCQCPSIPMALSIVASGKGGGVLDWPAEKISPGRQSEFDVK